ncbi:uncharacterized protein LOC128206591 [Mya arenaria]|uniref:uncharacterized protein LOC128206591 n=1 Tax=Mya arenaria TaxID=6604 RepID=UPI0022DF76B1|nr:uncharacterized protein LOC128206591 [Mya arenaria]
MEEPGQRRDSDSDLENGSADDTVYCKPCEDEGEHVKAVGFCQTCEEYMCDPCIKAHKKFKVTKNHIMLYEDKMPFSDPPIKQSDIGKTEYCQEHAKEMIKFYCPIHEDIGCGDCVLLEHRSCKVDYIADVAKDFVIGNKLEPSIKRAEDLLSAYRSNAGEILDDVENQFKDEIDRMRKFREEINNYLDQREEELLNNLQKAKNDDENVLNSLRTDCESAKIELEAMRTKLSSGDLSVNQQYVAARRAQKKLRAIHEEMEKIADRIKARQYRFTKNADMEHLLGSKLGFGTLFLAGEIRRDVPVPDLSTVTLKEAADIDVKTSQDQNTCGITGSALLSYRCLLLADYNNFSVKLVDVPSRTVTSRLQLPDKPRDVCVLPNDQAAVTFPFTYKVQLLSTKEGQLSRGKEIEVSSKCSGIASYNNSLYVSYTSNPRIEEMSLDGQIISTFQTDDGRQLFQAPYYLTVSASTPPTLYVSDHVANTVLQLSMDGKVLWESVDKLITRPESVVDVGLGQLLVCGHESNNVMLLTERDGKMTEILGENDGLTRPFSVTFCPLTRAIVVGMYNSDSLKVFKAH